MNSTKTNFFDVSSGVESGPGIKDSSKTTKFIELIKTYEN
jgi:phosphoribosylanthranilate isomerase